MGKFIITKDWKVAESDEKKLKKDFTYGTKGVAVLTTQVQNLRPDIEG